VGSPSIRVTMSSRAMTLSNNRSEKRFMVDCLVFFLVPDSCLDETRQDETTSKARRDETRRDKTRQVRRDETTSKARRDK
jgi:hypothetical protein